MGPKRTKTIFFLKIPGYVKAKARPSPAVLLAIRGAAVGARAHVQHAMRWRKRNGSTGVVVAALALFDPNQY